MKADTYALKARCTGCCASTGNFANAVVSGVIAEYRKPELLATGANQCWSWDITKLCGPNRGEWYALLVMLDIFSRMVVGWMLVRRANAAIAEAFIEQTIADNEIAPGTLTIHADRGVEMTAHPVCALLERLAVTRSHSRPHVSDDNPYSESQYKTIKYAADFLERFGSFEHARSHTRTFMAHYNTEHRHSGIAMLTPADVHAGLGSAKLAKRHAIVRAAFEKHPDRFIHGEPNSRASRKRSGSTSRSTAIKQHSIQRFHLSGLKDIDRFRSLPNKVNADTLTHVTRTADCHIERLDT